MRAHLAIAVTLSILPIALLGCTGEDGPTDPTAALSDGGGLLADRIVPHAVGADRLITMQDACDPASFNAVFGPGACTRRGGVTLDHFMAQLTRNQKAGGWMFAPPRTTARVGQTLLAVNRGGETHTFTPVASFGGGIVPLLNGLSGNPNVTFECAHLAPGDFVPAGGTHQEVVGAGDVQRFQCCIHPWMRTTVRTR